MNKTKDYTEDLTHIRSMMERTSRFHALSLWAGTMAGIYALIGAYIAYKFFNFNPDQIFYNPSTSGITTPGMQNIIFLAIIILALTVGTTIFLSYKKADRRKEKLWNPVARQLLVNLAVPLLVGGAVIVILYSKGLIGLMAPFSLIFYGLAIYNAGKIVYDDFKILGLIEISLGLISMYFVEYGLVCWALGFGVLHIFYGVTMHFKYEK